MFANLGITGRHRSPKKSEEPGLQITFMIAHDHSHSQEAYR